MWYHASVSVNGTVSASNSVSVSESERGGCEWKGWVWVKGVSGKEGVGVSGSGEWQCECECEYEYEYEYEWKWKWKWKGWVEGVSASRWVEGWVTVEAWVWVKGVSVSASASGSTSVTCCAVVWYVSFEVHEVHNGLGPLLLERPLWNNQHSTGQHSTAQYREEERSTVQENMKQRGLI